MQDRFLKILRLMVAHEDNRFCFDCHQRGPTYVDITIGSFVCTSCGGALRKYNHRVKSISMSNFTPSEMQFLRRRGNKACRRIYLATCEDQTIVEKEWNDAARDDYLRQKYQLMKWHREPSPSLEVEAFEENQKIMDQVESNGVQQRRSTRNSTTNAATGLLLPARKATVSTSDALGRQTSPVNGRSTASATKSVAPPTSPLFPIQSPPPPSLKQQAFSTPVSVNPVAALAHDPFSTTSAPASTDPFFSQAPVTDLFAQFSSTHHAQMPTSTAAADSSSSVPQQPLPITNAPLQSSWLGNTVQTTPVHFPQFNATRGNYGDKYAALAELDGIFRNVTIQPPTTDGGHAKPFVSLGHPPISSSASTLAFNTTPSAPVFEPTGPAHNPFTKNSVTHRHYSASNPFNSTGTTQPVTTTITYPAASVYPMQTTTLGSRNPFAAQPQPQASIPVAAMAKPTNPFFGQSTANTATPASFVPHVGDLQFNDSHITWPGAATNGNYVFNNLNKTHLPPPGATRNDPFSEFAAFDN